MTLVITMLAENKVVQVSDTRLTLGECEYDADAVKSMCVSCDDAYFTIGYSGLAEIERQRLDIWLEQTISEIMSAGFHAGKQIADKLIEHLDTKIASLTFRRKPVPRSCKGLLLTLAGFQKDPHDQSRFSVPFAVVISNIKSWELGKPIDLAEHFHMNTYFRIGTFPGSESMPKNADPSYFLQGERLALLNEDAHARKSKGLLLRAVRTLRRIDLGTESDAQTSASCLAAIIQRASNHPNYGKYIGPKCNSVVMHPDSDTMFSHYHSPGVAVNRNPPRFVKLTP